MLFTVIAKDRPNALEQRMALRPDHLAYCVAPVVRLAGPFFNDRNEMVGSLLIIEADDMAAAQAWLADEPFFKAGLFATSEISAWKPTLNFVGANF